MTAAPGKSITVATWNVNGFRARRGEVLAFVARERPDILCLQEIKATEDQLDLTMFDLMDYVNRWHGHEGGYSGTSLHIKKSLFAAPAFEHPAFDHEGRIVEGVMGDLVVASVYVPNGGKDMVAKLAFLRGLEAHVAELVRADKRVVLCGDMNVAREDRDVHPSQRREGTIGQRFDERELFAKTLAAGLVDVGRELAPDDDRLYTWWPYWREARKKNVGWRLDYVLATRDVARRARSCRVMREYGTSDHAPVVVGFEGLA
jgi:exodeoxyribonuclease-3